MTETTSSSLLTGKPLSGRCAVVTGAAAGIGRACAVRLADAGAAIALVDVDANGLEETAELIAGREGKAGVFRADLSDRGEIEKCLEAIAGQFPGIDILVNCAGITGQPGNLLESDEGQWDKVFAINVTAPYILMKRLSQQMVERGASGKIVNVTSSSAHRARSSLPAYGASKSALRQLTRTAAADLGPYGINVNAVAPGLTRTNMVGSAFSDEALESALREGPIANLFHRVSEPEDIADTVLFLCLPASRQITGQTIHVSAGAVV